MIASRVERPSRGRLVGLGVLVAVISVPTGWYRKIRRGTQRVKLHSEGGFAPLPTPLAHSARGCLPPEQDCAGGAGARARAKRARCVCRRSKADQRTLCVRTGQVAANC